MTAVMRPLDSPYINKLLKNRRRFSGLKLLDKKGATIHAPEILQSGGALAFIADQNAGRKGVFVDFFGRKASTYKSIALLAMQFEVPVVVGCARRTGKWFNYEMHGSVASSYEAGRVLPTIFVSCLPLRVLATVSASLRARL